MAKDLKVTVNDLIANKEKQLNQNLNITSLLK
jgi:predicted DNA-binding ribbon-helix-helix protein